MGTILGLTEILGRVRRSFTLFRMAQEWILRKFCIKWTLFLLISLLAQPSWAEIITDAGNYWLCRARDGDNREWLVQSAYEIKAINKAYEACKKQSNRPSSCRTAKEYCEVFIHGFSTKPLWRCTALDQMAKAWMSNTYMQRDDAALAAKAYCKEGSSEPDSCYINLLTCVNLNGR